MYDSCRRYGGTGATSFWLPLECQPTGSQPFWGIDSLRQIEQRASKACPHSQQAADVLPVWRSTSVQKSSPKDPKQSLQTQRGLTVARKENRFDRNPVPTPARKFSSRGYLPHSFQASFFSGNHQTPRGNSRFVKRTMAKKWGINCSPP